MALDPRQLRPEGRRQGPCEHRLANARDVFNEQVTTGKGGNRRGGERVMCTEQDLTQISHNGLTERDGGVEIEGTRGRHVNGTAAVPLHAVWADPLWRPGLLSGVRRLHHSHAIGHIPKRASPPRAALHFGIGSTGHRPCG